MKEQYKERVAELNKKLAIEYGWFTTDIPNFRISWSDDQFEWRAAEVAKFDDNGNKIGSTEGTQYLPKYRQWLPHMWVLERCCDVERELRNKELTTKYSYEPLFPFCDNKREPLPPDWDICWVVIARINYSMGQPIKVYKDPEANMTKEEYAMKIKKLAHDLFSNETDTSDALAYKEGIIVPSTYGAN